MFGKMLRWRKAIEDTKLFPPPFFVPGICDASFITA